MIKAAEQLGFTAKGVKGNQEAFFSEFPLPAIAHVDGGLMHYVVVHKITKNGYCRSCKGIVKYTLMISLTFGQVFNFNGSDS